MDVDPIGRVAFDAAELMRDHPPVFRLESKRMLFERIPVPITGTVTVMIPVAPPLHNTSVVATVVVSMGPAGTFTVILFVMQPTASVTTIV